MGFGSAAGDSGFGAGDTGGVGSGGGAGSGPDGGPGESGGFGGLGIGNPGSYGGEQSVGAPGFDGGYSDESSGIGKVVEGFVSMIASKAFGVLGTATLAALGMSLPPAALAIGAALGGNAFAKGAMSASKANATAAAGRGETVSPPANIGQGAGDRPSPGGEAQAAPAAASDSVADAAMQSISPELAERAILGVLSGRRGTMSSGAMGVPGGPPQIKRQSLLGV